MSSQGTLASELERLYDESDEDSFELNDEQSIWRSGLFAKQIKKKPILWRKYMLVLGILMMLLAGTLYCFGAYSSALKAQLRLSQEQADRISSIGILGMGFSCISGSVYDWKGPKWTSACGLFFGLLGYLMMHFTIQYSTTPATSSLLAGISLAVIVQGCFFTYNSALQTQICNFPRRYRGTVVSLIDAVFGISAALLNFIYAETFGSSNDPLQDNVKGWLLTLGSSLATVNLLAIIIMDKIPPPDDEPSNKYLHSPEESAKDDNSEKEYWFQTLITLPFILQLLMALAVIGLGMLFTSDIGYIIESAYPDDMSITKVMTVILPLSSCFGRLISGFLSDLSLRQISRSAWQTFGTLSMALGYLGTAYAMTSPIALGVCCFLLGFGFGINAAVTPTYISELFGTKNFGKYFGLLGVPASIFSYVYTMYINKVYDENAHSVSGTLICDGAECYQKSYMIASCTLCIAVILSVWCQILKKEKHQFI